MTSCSGGYRVITNNVRKFPTEPMKTMTAIMAPVTVEIFTSMLQDTASYFTVSHVMRQAYISSTIL